MIGYCCAKWQNSHTGERGRAGFASGKKSLTEEEVSPQLGEVLR